MNKRLATFAPRRQRKQREVLRKAKEINQSKAAPLLIPPTNQAEKVNQKNLQKRFGKKEKKFTFAPRYESSKLLKETMTRLKALKKFKSSRSAQ